MAAFLNPGGWGSEFAEYMDNYTHLAGMWLVGEDMPRETNRVTLNTSVKDKWGNAAPHVHFDDHDNEIATPEHALPPGQAGDDGGGGGPATPDGDIDGLLEQIARFDASKAQRFVPRHATSTSSAIRLVQSHYDLLLCRCRTWLAVHAPVSLQCCPARRHRPCRRRGDSPCNAAGS